MSSLSIHSVVVNVVAAVDQAFSLSQTGYTNTITLLDAGYSDATLALAYSHVDAFYRLPAMSVISNGSLALLTDLAYHIR